MDPGHPGPEPAVLCLRVVCVDEPMVVVLMTLGSLRVLAGTEAGGVSRPGLALLVPVCSRCAQVAPRQGT
jgi:hypothetical protein